MEMRRADAAVRRRRIKAETAAAERLTADRQSQVEEHRLAFFAKLRPFRALQQVYTPGATRMLAADAEGRNADAPAPAAEHVRLWLPSELPAHERANGCQGNVAEMEAQLRESQCRDALSNIRLKLHSKQHLIAFRNENLGGQVKQTRSRTLVNHLGMRVDIHARKYTDTHQALIILKGPDYSPQLKKLEKADLRLEAEAGVNETAAETSDRNAAKTLRKIGGRPSWEAVKTKTPTLSWIWTAGGALDDTEQDLHECKCILH
jgi:hypothetical protein